MSTEFTIFEEILGQIPISIEVNHKNNVINFIFKSGDAWEMRHDQDCCEDVSIEDIAGNIDLILNEPLLEAELITGTDLDADESGTWSFYKFGTRKSSVVIRWYGSSNGYYSEEVSFVKTNI